MFALDYKQERLVARASGVNIARLQAEFRMRASWWLYLLRWVDAEDIYVDKDGTLRLSGAVYYVLRDMIVSRPVEYEVLKTLLYNAFNYYHVEDRTLTAHQEHALTLADEAAARGENGARFVSVKLDIGVNAAYKLLARARSRSEMYISGGDSPNPSKARSQYEAIHRLEAAYVQPCPGHGVFHECDGRTKAGRDLCWHCYHHFGLEGERPPWLDFLILDARKARYTWAQDQVMLAAYDDERER